MKGGRGTLSVPFDIPGACAGQEGTNWESSLHLEGADADGVAAILVNHTENKEEVW